MMKRWNELGVLAVAVVAVLAVCPQASAQTGSWAASGGLIVAGDPDEPYTGDGGFEFSVWRVLAERWDVGLRLNQLSFSGERILFAQAPSLPESEADVTSAEVVARWYPLGSDAMLFPWISLGVSFAVSDSLDDQEIVEPGLGIVEGARWDVDGVGYSLEGGLRWDTPGGRLFLEGGLRYVVLGAETTAFVTLEGAPGGAEQTRTLTTDLDSVVASATVGFYF